MSPGHKKRMAEAVVAHGLCSGRRTCGILRLARATLWYRAGQRSDRQQQMVARLHALSAAHPRYGDRRMAALLRQEGWTVGKRQIQRLRRVEGLRVPPTKRKIARRGRSTGLPTRATYREQFWTLTEARVVIEDFRIDYNTRRPHRRLGSRSPVNYAALLPAVPTPVGLPPSGQRLPQPIDQPITTSRTNTRGGSKT